MYIKFFVVKVTVAIEVFRSFIPCKNQTVRKRRNTYVCTDHFV